MGGKDNNRYPAFNGLFTKVVYSTEMGAFVDTVEELSKYLEGLKPRPSEKIGHFKTEKLA